jgi:hypothetical protein
MVATRKSRRFLRILGLLFVLAGAVVVLGADRDPLTWLLAVGAFAAGRWTRPRRPRRRSPRPRAQTAGQRRGA